MTGEAHDRLGEVDVRRLDRNLVVDEHVARDHVLELCHGAEVADAERLDVLGILALHEEHLAHPLLRMRARVDERRVARDRAGEDAEAADAAGEWVGDRLEDEHGLLRVAELDRRALLRRGRDTLDEQVEERGRAEVLRRDAAGDRVELVARHRRLERVGNRLRVELLALEVAAHELLVGLDHRVEELLPMLLHEVGHRVGDRLRPALTAAGGIHVRAHVEKVDDPGQLVLAADRKLDRDATVGELRPNRLEHAEEVGALAVEHVDEEDARKLLLLGALPDSRGVDLDPHHAAEHDDDSLDDTQRRECVGLEAGVAGRVDEVDLAVLPLEVAQRPRQRHAAPLLVLVPVRDRRPLLDAAEPVRLPRLEQEGLDE